MKSRKGLSKRKRFVLTPGAPDSLRTWAVRHIAWARTKNYSERTLEGRLQNLTYFIHWAEVRDVVRAADVTRPILERYMRYLYHYRKPDGRPLSFSAQLGRVMPLRAFFRWLCKQNVILANPASDLDLPRQEKRIPKAVLTALEVERVLAMPDVRHPLGLRDRAMLEVLYSTAIRRAELVGLDLQDLDVDRGTLLIRQGKGKKDRMVPMGERAMAWTERYLSEVRPGLLVPLEKDALFLTSFGERFALLAVSNIVRDYVLRADLGKKGSCHLFRHTAATLMLENGADIRFIQELLGHSKLTTTQIYTQVSIRKLQEVHRATHPGAKLVRRPVSAGASSPAAVVKAPVAKEPVFDLE